MNGLFPSWTDATCLFKSLFWKNCSHRPQIWIAYFLLEQMQHVFSSHSFEKIYVHKLHIWMAYFHHELMKHVLLSLKNICSRQLYNWIARIEIKSTSVYPWTVVLNRKVVGLKARGLIWPIIYSDSIAMHRPKQAGLKSEPHNAHHWVPQLTQKKGRKWELA